jgi:hypothetical protein
MKRNHALIVIFLLLIYPFGIREEGKKKKTEVVETKIVADWKC